MRNLRVNKRLDHHDLSEVMLYVMFNILEDYVEVDKAVQLTIIDEEYNSQSPSFWQNTTERLGGKQWRRPALGVYRLEQEQKIDLDDGKPSEQAKLAKEVMDLYTWWKAREYRADPYDALIEKYGSTDLHNADLKELERVEKQWDKWQKEDQKMVLRLIKIRPEMWS